MHSLKTFFSLYEQIEDFGMTAPRDTLVIRDGNDPASRQLASLSGSAAENPKYITSTGNQLYLYLTTSGNGGTPGFQIKYYQGMNQNPLDNSKV